MKVAKHSCKFRSSITVASVSMGYGHLRAASAIASEIGTTLVSADQKPAAGIMDRLIWSSTRALYENVSRKSQSSKRVAALLNSITRIPHNNGGAPDFATRFLEGLLRCGFGSNLNAYLKNRQSDFVTTFYAPALAVGREAGSRVVCIVTDTVAHRIWAPFAAHETSIHYCTPTQEASRLLAGYGVPSVQISTTGFPLPSSLLGGPDLGVARCNLARRLCRLDKGQRFQSSAVDRLIQETCVDPALERQVAPHLTFAVGGAGSQVEGARLLLRELRQQLDDGELRLTLVAGTRSEVAVRFQKFISEFGLDRLESNQLNVLIEKNFESYQQSFEQTLADTDLLWTKPSELVFYAGLGLPIVLAEAVGDHERHNREWLTTRGAVVTPDSGDLSRWLRAELASGRLAETALAAYQNIEQRGLYKIIELLGRRGFTSA